MIQHLKHFNYCKSKGLCNPGLQQEPVLRDFHRTSWKLHLAGTMLPFKSSLDKPLVNAMQRAGPRCPHPPTTPAAHLRHPLWHHALLLCPHKGQGARAMKNRAPPVLKHPECKKINTRESGQRTIPYTLATLQPFYCCGFFNKSWTLTADMEKKKSEFKCLFSTFRHNNWEFCCLNTDT